MRRRTKATVLRPVDHGRPGPTSLPPDPSLSAPLIEPAAVAVLDPPQRPETEPAAGPEIDAAQHSITRVPVRPSAPIVPNPVVTSPSAVAGEAPVEASGPAEGDAVGAVEAAEPSTRAGSAGLIQRSPDTPSDPPPPPSVPPGQPTDTKSGSGASSTTITVKPSTRDISAPTLSALWDAMTRSGTREAASVQPKLTPAPVYEYDEEDRVKSVVVKVVEEKEMPRWVEAESQCPPIRAEWTRFHGVLDAHEDRHIAIDRRHYDGVHKQLVGKKREAAWAALDAVVDAADKANESYDQDSNHGIKEGANINAAVQCAPEKVPNASSSSAPPPAAATPDGGGVFANLVTSLSGLLQARLEVSQPGDPLEAEAERVADAVAEEGGPVPSITAGASSAASRECAAPGPCDCPSCRAARPTADVQPIVGAVVGTGGGAPLDERTRARMEARIGHDFGHVRIHAGDSAARSAAAIHARAYTVGHEIVFGAGQFAPQSVGGQRLIAHELTHVVQQGSSPRAVQRDPAPSSPQPPTMNAPGQPASTSATSVRVKVSTGADPEYTSNSRNSGQGIVVFSANADATFESLRQLGAQDMWNLACVIGNLNEWAATTPDPAPGMSPAGSKNVQLSNPNPADTEWEEGYRKFFPSFKQHVQAFYKAFKSFEESFKDRGTKATLGMIEEARARTKRTIDELGIEAVVESERGPMGAEYSTSYKSKSDKIKQLGAAAAKLAAKQEALDKLVEQDKDRSGTIHWIFTSKETLDKENAELPGKVAAARVEWETERREAHRKFPILSHFETAAALKSLSNDAATAHHVGAKLFEVLDNIKEIEDKLKDNKSRILTLGDHLDRLKEAFALSQFERQTVTYMKEKYTGDIETGQRMLTLIAVVVGAIATGGAGGVVFAAAALAEAGINTALLLQAYDQYSLEKAAAGSSEDKAEALAKEEPSFYWLAFQVVTTLVGLKGNASTVMAELKTAFNEIKTSYKLAAASGETGPLNSALKAKGVSKDAAESIVARALKESVAILEGIAKSGPEGLQAALEMLKTSPNFYGVRLAVARLKAAPEVARTNLQAARQQVVNKIVSDLKSKYPKATFATVDQGFEKPIVIKIGAVDAPPPAPPPPAPTTATATATTPPSSTPLPPLPPDVQTTPVKLPDKGTFVQTKPPSAPGQPASSPSGGPAPASAGTSSPLGGPAQGPAASPAAGSVVPPPPSPAAGSVQMPPAQAGGAGTATSTGGGAQGPFVPQPVVQPFQPPMAPPEGVGQAVHASEELRQVPNAALGGAPAAAGTDLTPQLDAAVAPFGPMTPELAGYHVGRGVTQPQYTGIYLTADTTRFVADADATSKLLMTKDSMGKVVPKGSSGKFMLRDATTSELYVFKPAGMEALVSDVYQVQPGTFFVRGRAAYDIGLDLPTVGASLVPTAVVVHDGRIGSLQKFLKNTENLSDLSKGTALNPALTPDAAKQLYREIWEQNATFAKLRDDIRAFDHIINNPDRNLGNFMVELNEDLSIKRFWAIDQDLALTPGARTIHHPGKEFIPKGSPSPYAGNMPAGLEQQYLGKISKTLYDEMLLLQANSHSFKEALVKIYGLTDQAAEGVLRRLEEVVRDIDARLATMKPEDVFHQ